MSRALLYNPENDLALAAGIERFTPPAAGRIMAEAGALLPLWWADDGDGILAPQRLSAEAARMKERFNLNGSIGIDTALSAEPWGWSAYTRRRLIDAGMNADRLPSPEAIDRIRSLSHRRTSIAIHQAIGTPHEQLPVEATSTAAAIDTIHRFGNAVIKQPWSCSGRGVIFSRAMSVTELSRHIEGCIRRQGSVIIEPEYERINEMAALYYCDNGTAHFRGMSAFSSGITGSYTGNIVAPQSTIRHMCGSDAIESATALAPILSAIIGHAYTGWLGIDMLRHTAGLNPCMELNLRMTMGVVAMYVADKALSDGEHGVIRILPSTQTSDDGNYIDLSPTDAALKIVLVKNS